MSGKSPKISNSKTENNILSKTNENPSNNQDLSGFNEDNRPLSPATVLFNQIPYPPQQFKSFDDLIRLTVVNETNFNSVIDVIRIELKLNDFVLDALKLVCFAKQIRCRDTVKLVNYWGVDLKNKDTLAECKLYDLSVVRLRFSGKTSEKDDPEWDNIKPEQFQKPEDDEVVPLVQKPVLASIPKEKKPSPLISTTPKIVKIEPLEVEKPTPEPICTKRRPTRPKCIRPPIYLCCCRSAIIFLILALILILLLIILLLLYGYSYKTSVLIETGPNQFLIRKFRWKFDDSSTYKSKDLEQYSICDTVNGTDNQDETVNGTVFCIKKESFLDYNLMDINSSVLFMVDFEKNSELLSTVKKSIEEQLFDKYNAKAEIKNQYMDSNDKIAYKWVAMNYLLNTFYAYDNDSTNSKIYNYLEVENSTLKFISQSASSSSGNYKLQISNTDYDLNVFTVNCQDLDAVKKAYLSKKISEKSDGAQYVNLECYSVESEEPVKAESLLDTDLSEIGTCPVNLPLDTLKFNGSINQQACEESIGQLLQSVSIPNGNTDSDFYISGDFVELVNRLAIDSDTTETSLSQLIDNACARADNWRCFDLLYFRQLFLHKFQFNLTRLQYANEIGDRDWHWTLGFMVHQVFDKFTADDGQSNIGLFLPLIVYYVLIYLILLLLIVSIILFIIGGICYFCCCCCCCCVYTEEYPTHSNSTKVYYP